MQIRAMHMDAWGRIILEFRELGTRPPVRMNFDEVSSSSLLLRLGVERRGGDIESRHRFDPLELGRKGDAVGKANSCNLCNMTVDGIVFGTTPPPRRLQSEGIFIEILISS